MYVNIIESYRNIIAISDKELIGKQFEEGKKILHIKESFYKGENDPKEIQEVKEIMINWVREDATFNIVGEKSINTAIEAGIIDKDSVGKIDGIPYALILL